MATLARRTPAHLCVVWQLCPIQLTIIHVLVTSCLYYCKVLYMGVPLKSIQTPLVQNAAVRVVDGTCNTSTMRAALATNVFPGPACHPTWIGTRLPKGTSFSKRLYPSNSASTTTHGSQLAVVILPWPICHGRVIVANMPWDKLPLANSLWDHSLRYNSMQDNSMS